MSQPHFGLVPAAYVYLLKGDHVLLQRRQGTGYMDGHWVAGAAGHIELGETAALCAVREAREELGIDIAAQALLPLTVMQRTDGTDEPREQRIDWFFAAREWSGTPQVMEPHKCAEVAWHPLASLPDPIPTYERTVLTGLARSSLPVFTSHGFEPQLGLAQ